MRQATFAFALALCCAVASASPQPDFETGVLPIFHARCLPCHSGAKPQAGLDLTSRESILKGGKSGPAMQSGSSEKSLLIEKVVSQAMPPAGAKLNDAEITAIRRWIDSDKPAQSLVTENDVLPIFQMRCVTCHGKRKQEGGLDLRGHAAQLRGGKSGPSIVPGNPEASLLYKRIVSGQMPPPKLLVEAFVRPPSNTEVELLRQWIAGGALPAPPEPAAEIEDRTVTDKDRQHWAFLPPKRPAVPTVAHGELVRNPIDAFLLTKLETKKLSFSPAAERIALLRRVTLDVTGIPPTSEEIEAFRNDSRSDAYESLVDRLLASPRYGERWAKFWLDAAGYSDSEGIIDEDRVRPDAWRYRDYVIRALNADKPFDRFLVEQIAGDELVDPTSIKEVTPEIIDTLAATGFLRMVPDGTYSPANGSIAERMNVIADEIEVVSSSVMGLTVGCARCHNHKYDPLPQRDYYRLSAILQSAYDPYDWVKPTERNLDVAFDSERQQAAAHNAPIEAEIKRAEAELAALGPEPNKDKAAALNKQIAEAKAKLKPKPQIRALYEMGGEPSPAYLLRRGEAQQIGERVSPGVPSVLKIGLTPYTVTPPRANSTGRRLGFARWLTQPQHPLTARVAVNRIWMHHFGRGIVASAANFGRMGTPPSHPELLEWLATEFVARGWSMKAMHRLILTSTAYRQASAAPPELRAADPENVLVSRMTMRRMDAEQLHDSILSVSGELDGKMFGPAVAVEVKPSGEVVSGGVRKDGVRRGIYGLQRRSKPVTLLEVFDLPPMSPNCIVRPYSTVATQALEMTNSPFVRERARYLAGRLLDAYPQDPRKQVELLYVKALARRPAIPEVSAALRDIDGLASQWTAHLNNEKSEAPRVETARWQALADFCQAILISAEFTYVD
jgi:hypothetical protein